MLLDGRDTDVSPISRLTRDGLTILFPFVALVPHRYLQFPALGNLSGVTAWVPAMMVLILGGLCFHRMRRLSDPILKVIGAWIFAGILADVVSEVPALALSRLFYFGITGALAGLLLALVSSAENLVSRFWSVTIGAAVIVAAIGVLEFVTGQPVLWGEVFSPDNPVYARFANDSFGRRILSTVGHPVYLGAFLVATVPLALHYLVFGRDTYRVVGALAVGLLIAALILTFSRGAYVACLIALAVYLRGHLFRHRIVVGIGILLLVGITLVSGDVIDTLSGRDTTGQLKGFFDNQRGTAYGQSALLSLDAPLLGIGTGHYRYLSRRYQDYNDTPDNMYLRTLAEGGVVGLTLLILIIVTAVRRLAELESTGNLDPSLYRAFRASILGVSVDMMTCDLLQFPLTRLLFWFLIGSAVALYTASDRTRFAKY